MFFFKQDRAPQITGADNRKETEERAKPKKDPSTEPNPVLPMLPKGVGPDPMVSDGDGVPRDDILVRPADEPAVAGGAVKVGGIKVAGEKKEKTRIPVAIVGRGLPPEFPLLPASVDYQRAAGAANLDAAGRQAAVARVLIDATIRFQKHFGDPPTAKQRLWFDDPNQRFAEIPPDVQAQLRMAEAALAKNGINVSAALERLTRTRLAEIFKSVKALRGMGLGDAALDRILKDVETAKDPIREVRQNLVEAERTLSKIGEGLVQPLKVGAKNYGPVKTPVIDELLRTLAEDVAKKGVVESTASWKKQLRKRCESSPKK